MALTWEKFVEKLCTEAQSDALYHHPIGSIYQSLDSTSPATLFGGTWAALGGRVLIGVDGTYTAGATGGAATHTLTVAEMPAHNHDVAPSYGGTAPTTNTNNYGKLQGADGYTALITGVTPEVNKPIKSRGDGEAHNNMPPYLAVYMWKRTA